MFGIVAKGIAYCGCSLSNTDAAYQMYARPGHPIVVPELRVEAFRHDKRAAGRVVVAKNADHCKTRLGVRRTGCSGYAYVIDYADAVNADDVVFDDAGVKVIVDNDSLGLIDGTQVDFVKEGLNEAFKFRNPNVKGECGCGESFSVDG
jgi:iron-sulfur cluster assembly protein